MGGLGDEGFDQEGCDWFIKIGATRSRGVGALGMAFKVLDRAVGFLEDGPLFRAGGEGDRRWLAGRVARPSLNNCSISSSSSTSSKTSSFSCGEGSLEEASFKACFFCQANRASSSSFSFFLCSAQAACKVVKYSSSSDFISSSSSHSFQGSLPPSTFFTFGLREPNNRSNSFSMFSTSSGDSKDSNVMGTLVLGSVFLNQEIPCSA
mmetsp:Transcript_3018/g.4600  ORF Transcript_3018/g.4600 Transcript_3018/m.4600 type:complete len:207 (+) Transcript_3018:812-1432(+)